MISFQDLTEREQRELLDLSGFLSFQTTEPAKKFFNCPSKIIFLDAGNQFGKNATVVEDYVLRILGRHPVAWKNIRPEMPIRTIRFASETLPNDPTGAGVKNTQYPAFLKVLPRSLLKKDITARTPVQTIRSPLGGPDIFIEYVSFGQEVQAQAGQQRLSIWIDELSSQEFFGEQIPRILAADGDIIISYTPTPGKSSWIFEDLFSRARRIYRSDAVRRRIQERHEEEVPMWEISETGNDITVIMAATDDNPTFTREQIDRSFSMYTDEDELDGRRYGLFRQISGKMFKNFASKHHLIDGHKYFPDGIPKGYVHFRTVDYHDNTPWACVWIAKSLPTEGYGGNELFVYDELRPDPTRNTTPEISRQMALKSRDYLFRVNEIDPLAAKNQPNSATSVIEDLNRIFSQMKKEGLCSGGYWEAFDTKSHRGLDQVRIRLKNSILVGRPFNNTVLREGRKEVLPTLWFCNNCVHTIESFKNWRISEWATRSARETNDDKDEPEQKWSHFCRAVECLLKNEYVSKIHIPLVIPQRPMKRYFAGMR